MALNDMQSLLEWIERRNANVKVTIAKICLDQCEPWRYENATGNICKPDRSFFQISGICMINKNGQIVEQPIILQPEIGYLGIIRKRIAGDMHYLMQAKIEPGNVNKIQISPTIQATKSNFSRKHGGSEPSYLGYFVNAPQHRIIVDQIQSEQSSRFLSKRNRNIIIELREDEDIDVLPTHMWMTMGQIKELMRYENLVNMDTRTVVSCLPLEPEIKNITDEFFARSIEGSGVDYFTPIYDYINDYKMFEETNREFVPLFSLKNWEMRNNEFVCKSPYSFKIVFCDIDIEGREVKHWCQPLLESTGIATFGLITRVKNRCMEFLVQAKPEIGCFDKIELGPSVQREYVEDGYGYTEVDELFDERLKSGEGVKFNNLLSEEGGRFYADQNRNVVIEIDGRELSNPPKGYFWTDYKTLSLFLRMNNCLNVQLRNLLAVMEW